MEQLNINHILERFDKEKLLIDCLNHFEKNKTNVLTRRGIYIYGSPGSGKTYFVKEILKKLDYDTILFDAGDFRPYTNHKFNNDPRSSIRGPCRLYPAKIKDNINNNKIRRHVLSQDKSAA